MVILSRAHAQCLRACAPSTTWTTLHTVCRTSAYSQQQQQQQWNISAEHHPASSICRPKTSIACFASNTQEGGNSMRFAEPCTILCVGKYCRVSPTVKLITIENQPLSLSLHRANSIIIIINNNHRVLVANTNKHLQPLG